MHLFSYLRSAEEIIGLYEGTIPFASWLKNYFRQHKKFGSKDRRLIADLCFCYFRLGHAFGHLPVEEQLLTGQFLCHEESVFVEERQPAWSNYLASPLAEKLLLVKVAGDEAFFPCMEKVSSEINSQAFNLSHLVQPDLFLRIRPGQREAVQQKLQASGLSYLTDGDCVRLPNASKIDGVLDVDKEAVVQDKNSQRVLDLLPAQWQKASFTAWDCCAASGGKSLLLHDGFPKARLTVSDIRETILHNLRNRFKRAGIRAYRSFVADLSSADFQQQNKFDLIVCDAPCSGSGTWGRTPEQLRFFQRDKVERYASLQKNITINASRSLTQGGAFLYVTCSVFKEENEVVTKHLQQHTPLRLQEQRYFSGYAERADTLFAALFTL